MKNLLIIAILILSSFNARCQTSLDSTNLANKDINVLLQISDERNKLKKEVANLSERVEILESRIQELNANLLKKKSAIAVYENGIAGYRISEKSLIDQRTNLEKALKKLTRQLKWAKTKLFIFAVVVVGGAVTLLIVNK